MVTTNLNGVITHASPCLHKVACILQEDQSFRRPLICIHKIWFLRLEVLNTHVQISKLEKRRLARDCLFHLIVKYIPCHRYGMFSSQA
jgi:hypothetical protein